jgi:bifunctional non-homologous end joining protein LigD
MLPEGPQWHYELKFDGYRMQVLNVNGSVRLISRNGADYTRRFAEVSQVVVRLKPKTIHLDGELVAMDRQGRPGFQVLQSRGPLPPGWRYGYYAFDLLHLGKRSLHYEPLAKRRALLREVLDGSGLRFSARLDGNAAQVIAAVREHPLEGVVAKRVDSVYESGKRSGAWVKLPLKRTGQFLIGAIRPAGKSFSHVLVGRFEGRQFKYAGKVRYGFDARNRVEVLKAAARLLAGKCVFCDLPNAKADAFDEMVTAEEIESFVWLRPEVVAEIAFAEWTRFGALRHAEFVRLP